MDAPGALAQLRAQLAFSADPGPWHSAPTFGKPHEFNPQCWCEPKPDHIDPRIYVHTPSH